MTEPTLISGGTGFVGRRLIEMLIANERATRMIVRKPLELSSVDVVRLDQFSLDEFREATTGINTVCHLAGRAHVVKPPHGPDWSEYHRVNVELSCNLAKASFEKGVRRFIFVSSIGAVGSSSVPGRPLRHDSPCHPQSAYGRSKLEAERRLCEIANSYGAELVIVRPPLVHGKEAPGNFARLARLIQKGVPLPLGSVRNQKSLIHVTNLAKFLYKCLDDPNAANNVFHVRDRIDYSIEDIICGIGRATGRSPRLVRTPTNILRLMAGATGSAGALSQLIGWLQVDDDHARRTLQFTPDDLPIGS